ncbi:non-ribosomal peptide synthetase [Bradyrhizobium sp. B120]|uniref:non-ribosomal peptide synthetase n=1 Tax=Bradyrhizobium sp. B120 TaxID=3410088 RepID=UPI003B987DAB
MRAIHFDRETITRFVGHFRTLLEGIVADPQARVGELPLLTEAERHRQLVAWNATSAAVPDELCLHELFERQAGRTPEAAAVVHGNGRLTYRELDTRANQLAHHLRGLGVGPDVLVGICIERSLEMVVGLLAVLKAGGAYLPLDPDYPPARLSYMPSDSHAPVLLTQAKLAHGRPERQASVVCVDTDWPVIARHPLTPLINRARPQNLAYCIYTSGSTGAPKGVGVPHRGVLNLVTWHRDAYRLGPGDRVSQVAGLAFDACAWEVWGCLTAGATLCLPDEETRGSPTKIIEWLARESISLAFLATPMAEAALAEGWPTGIVLRTLLTGGEALHCHARAGDGFKLVNHYGPTEASVVATAGVVESFSKIMPPSIGRPISNCRIYILDRNCEPVPIGVIGEMHIGGIGLARGYLNRPELTAERFHPDPFADNPGNVMYSTGDLARYRANGEIDILGRRDIQLKVRGYRIELREIEEALISHPAIRECVVVAVPGPAMDRRLVAHVVTKEGAISDPTGWRQHLREQLPEYMLPSIFMKLDLLPTTPNGKIDRAALPAPVHSDTGVEFVAPRNSVERSIAEIWCDLLGLDSVGIHDNFFTLGDQSLLAVRLIARIRAALGVELSLRAFFDQPTIGETAARAETLRWLSEGFRDPGGGAELRTVGEI